MYRTEEVSGDYRGREFFFISFFVVQNWRSQWWLQRQGIPLYFYFCCTELKKSVVITEAGNSSLFLFLLYRTEEVSGDYRGWEFPFISIFVVQNWRSQWWLQRQGIPLYFYFCCTELKKSVVITEAGNSRDPQILATKISNFHRVIEASHG